ncbi:hypothetical protein CTI12_AA108480 [Artemisia annua]|uniref:Uncharacterized protein n=1 Tax=Artemisia annua TaxID=35608 RepID=A0A2U1PVE6_ARTAN|nr:hypothetical protein CTI12_AA108480 [Artemisia annua]
METRHNPNPSMHKNGGKVVQQEDKPPLYSSLAPSLASAAEKLFPLSPWNGCIHLLKMRAFNIVNLIVCEDNPVGTRYSFANNKEGLVKTDQHVAAALTTLLFKSNERSGNLRVAVKDYKATLLRPLQWYPHKNVESRKQQN